MNDKAAKNLFLTGPIGSGKSTSISNALQKQILKAGGFLTVRQKDDEGRAIAYWMQRPDGTERQIIIDYSSKPYTMHLEVFENAGLQLLEDAKNYPFVILDEIGGFELLSDRFLKSLMVLLQSDIPCIGVMKAAGAAGKMIQKLGLGQVYESRAETLRQWMQTDENTRLYECGQFDPEGLRLAQEWVNEHLG